MDSQIKLTQEEAEQLKEKYENSLQESIESVKRAYEEEFATAERENCDLAVKAETILFSGAETAAKRLVYLVEHAEKENVQSDCAKFILNNTVAKLLAKSEKDEALEKLIAELTAND